MVPGTTAWEKLNDCAKAVPELPMSTRGTTGWPLTMTVTPTPSPLLPIWKEPVTCTPPVMVLVHRSMAGTWTMPAVAEGARVVAVIASDG